MRRSEFDDDGYHAYLLKNQQFFHDRYPLGNLYGSPQSNVPMLFHIYELLADMWALLKKLVDEQEPLEPPESIDYQE